MRLLILLMGVCLVSFVVNAQSEMLYTSRKRIQLGFHLGMNLQDLHVVMRDGGAVCAGIPAYTPGVSLGLITTFHFNPYFSLRAVPTVHFGRKKLLFYDSKENIIERADIRSGYLSIPLGVKFRGARLINCRPYLVAGFYGSYNVQTGGSGLSFLSRFDYGIEIGMGCEVYLPFFKLSPEIKFCVGLPNLLPDIPRHPQEEELSRYWATLYKVTSRMLVFTFNFE